MRERELSARVLLVTTRPSERVCDGKLARRVPAHLWIKHPLNGGAIVCHLHQEALLKLTRVADPVSVSVELMGVSDKRTAVLAVLDAVPISIITDHTDAIIVIIALVRVVDLWTVVMRRIYEVSISVISERERVDLCGWVGAQRSLEIGPYVNA